MKIIKKVMSLLVLFAVSLSTFGQNTSPSTFPKILPPSPEAQSFMRYGEIPVDYSTGVPNIEVPIFNIQSGKLSLPVSLTYHASGIKVSDIASVAGLGWRLFAGGALTRTVLGVPDDDVAGILNSNYFDKSEIDNPNNRNTDVANRLNFTTKGNHDSESDRYFYSAGDKLAGDFLYDNSLNLVQTSYSDCKISKLSPTSYQIIADDGTKYLFATCEYTQTDYASHISTWWLSKIISSDNIDTIAFEYETQTPTSAQYVWNQSLTLRNPPPTDPIDYSSTLITTPPVLLRKIKFKHGYLTFNYIADRKDMQPHRLSIISVFDNSDKLMSKFQLQHSYFYSGLADNKYNYRMKLDRVDVYDGNSIYLHNYSFEYDQTHPMPPYIKGPNLTNSLEETVPFGVDHFGYFNGQQYNQHLIPNLPTGYPTINRESNFDYAKTCILTKINYPTGGFSSFEYQLNDPMSEGFNISSGAGLRIHKIISKPSVNESAITKRYEYTNNMVSEGLDILSWNNYEFRPFVWQINCEYIEMEYFVYFASPILPYANFKGAHALYQYVNEFIEGGTNNSLKTVYRYTSENDVLESVTSMRYGDQFFLERPWRKGLLAQVDHFKLTSTPPSTPAYSPVKSVSYEYGNYRVNTIVCGTKIQRIHEHWQGTCTNPFLWREFSYYPGEPLNLYFHYFDTKVEVGVKKLTGEIVSEYDGNGNSLTIAKNTSYSSQNHLFPTSVTTTNSKNESQAVTLKYPHDFAGSSVYDAMIARNMISPVIEQVVNKNGTSFLQSSRTNYNYWYNNSWGVNNANSLIVPQTAETKNYKQANYETQLRYISYDAKGNIESISKENDVKETYIWGYQQQYPVARIIGKSYSEVFALVTLDNSIINGALTTDANMRQELNKLRALTGCLVTTYTYKPLVGMTSQTDPNNRTTYYSYDAFNRLQIVRDQDGKIIKKICYNYKGQPEDCSVNVSPVWTTTGSLRCATSGGVNTGYQEREERDTNPNSTTYNQTQWVSNGYNTTACPLPNNCNYYSCEAGGPQYHCVNGVCEFGYKIYTDSYYDYYSGMYVCYYHYEWSDGVWSSDFTEYSYGPCNYYYN